MEPETLNLMPIQQKEAFDEPLKRPSEGLLQDPEWEQKGTLALKRSLIAPKGTVKISPKPCTLNPNPLKP